MIISQDNKRDFFRMLINAECDVAYGENQETVKLTAICKDMSATGMAIETDCDIAVGTSVNVSIESQSSHFASMEASCKVVRVERHTGGRYVIGLNVLSFDN